MGKAIILWDKHLPWYEPKAGEEDMRFSPDTLIVYLALCGEADNRGRVSDTVAGLMEDARMSRMLNSNAVSVMQVIARVSNRSIGWRDTFHFTMENDAADIAHAKPSTRVRLTYQTSKNMYAKGESYVSVSTEEIQKISKVSKNYRGFKIALLIFIWILSQMYTRRYENVEGGMTIRGGVASIGYGTIANALGMKDETVAKYCDALERQELIRVKIGHGLIHTRIYYPGTDVTVDSIDYAKEKLHHSRYGGVV